MIRLSGISSGLTSQRTSSVRRAWKRLIDQSRFTLAIFTYVNQHVRRGVIHAPVIILRSTEVSLHRITRRYACHDVVIEFEPLGQASVRSLSIGSFVLLGHLTLDWWRKHNDHWNYLHYERESIGVCMNTMNNRASRGIRSDRDENRTSNCRWFSDVEKDCNRIRSVTDADRGLEETFETSHLSPPPRIRPKQQSLPGRVTASLTWRPWTLPASYRFSPVKISLLQKSRKLSVTRETRECRSDFYERKDLLLALFLTWRGTS